MVPYRDNQSFVMADIPGIIEGAHLGKGLGHRFLRHIERNSALLFLVAADSPNILKEYKILVSELEKFNPELLDKKRMLAISKCDLLDESGIKKMQKKKFPIPHILISSHTQLGLLPLKDAIWKMLNT
ncbi:MAG TPA: GTPase ObgE, partial [Bacteroidales bacterium]|nr:GTPase ObgE [Bacteroidales bacterium]